VSPVRDIVSALYFLLLIITGVEHVLNNHDGIASGISSCLPRAVAHCLQHCHTLYVNSFRVHPDVLATINKNIAYTVKVMDQLDATKYAVFIVSTCFGHQYAHRQEYN
jgi:hypothetical protein